MLTKEELKKAGNNGMTIMENCVMNLTGCTRQIANTVVNTFLNAYNCLDTGHTNDMTIMVDYIIRMTGSTEVIANQTIGKIHDLDKESEELLSSDGNDRIYIQCDEEEYSNGF